MPSKMSLINKEIILQIGRSVGWISIIYFLGLFFALPLQVIMLASKEQIEYVSTFETLFRFQNEIQVGMILFIPVLLAVFLFRFLQIKQSADLMHSLPIKREKIYHHFTLAGILMLVIPIVLNMGILLALLVTKDISNFYSPSDVWIWGGETLLLTLFIYLSGVFMAMLTGISAVQGVLTYIILLLPVGAFVLIGFNLRFLLFGFPMEYYMNQDFHHWSPLTMTVYLNEFRMGWVNALVFIALALLFYFMSLAIYKKRKIETASQAITFSKLESIFKYGATFFTMLLVGMYFDLAQNDMGWTIFGYILGSLLGYYLSEMVLQKTWRVFRLRKGLLIYAASMIVIITGLQISLSSYEANVPDINDIENVLITENSSIFLKNNHVYYDFKPRPLKEKENIKAVQEFHQAIVSNKNTTYSDTPGLYFVYKMKDGTEIVREYRVNQKAYANYFKAVYETEEYKKATNELFSVNEAKVSYMIINSVAPVKDGTKIFEPNDIQSGLEALRKDVLNESYEGMNGSIGVIAGVDIQISNKRSIYVPLKSSYKNFNNWLDQKGLLEESTMSADDVDYAKIIQRNELMGHEIWDERAVLNIIEKSKSARKFTETNIINELINASNENMQGEYVVVFFMDDRHAPIIRTIEEKDLP